jgi:hypothetical protein
MTGQSGDAYGGTIAKRRLAMILTHLRLDRGLTASQVCTTLGWGRGKLGRFEMNRWKRPDMSDIRDLLRLYRVSRGERGRVVQLAALARQRPWWREYGDIFDTEYPGYENDAGHITVFVPLAVPALLQTPAYTRAHAARTAMPTSWRDRFVETMLSRQRILHRECPTSPTVVAVITEAALCYDWGTSADRREQAIRLLELGQRPNIEIRLYPFAAGPYPEPLSPVSHLRFGDESLDMLFIETGPSTLLVNDPAQARVHAEQLSRALIRAHDRLTTLTYLARLTGG